MLYLTESRSAYGNHAVSQDHALACYKQGLEFIITLILFFKIYTTWRAMQCISNYLATGKH